MTETHTSPRPLPPRGQGFVATHRDLVLSLLRNEPGYSICERLTWEVDAIVVAALEDALLKTPEFAAPSPATALQPRLPDRWALMALGGYGRGQMSLRSDIDIQLVIPDGAPDPLPLMEVFLDHLTRRGLKLGHGVRTVNESVMLASTEATFATAALTARHLAGDPTATEAVRAPVYQNLSGAGLAHLLEFVTADRARRAERLGDTVFVLEPDLKHGIGGLRDAQLVAWLGLITGRPPDRRVAFAEDLLIRARMALHALVGFKCDRLALEHQAVVAAALGYGGDEDQAATDLMRDVHLALRVLASRARRHLEIAAHRISTPRRTLLTDHLGYATLGTGQGTPLLVRADGTSPRTISDAVSALRVVARTGFPLSAELEGGCEELALNLERPQAPRPEVLASAETTSSALADLLMELLLDPGRGASLALHTLHRTGLLVALVPEFRPILGRVQRDLYHVYTVDEHTLRALDKLKSIARGEHEDLALATSRIRPLPDDAKRALAVATFLHDLGKGYGPGHHERSATLAQLIGPRLGLSEPEVELVRLLVRHQADMPMIGLRRDLNDPRPIRGLARLAGHTATLDALYLLSIADWSSVGPSAFSAWQRSLLDQLYLRARDLLESTDALYVDDVGLAEARRNALVALELGEIPEVPSATTDPIDDFLSALPTRYFQTIDVATMHRHYRLWRRYEAGLKPELPDEVEPRTSSEVEVIAEPSLGLALVTVVCADNPGVLAQLTGALAEVGADVRSAEIASLAGGTVLDVFRVSDPHGRFGTPRGTGLFKSAFARALAGEPPRPRKPEAFAPGLGLPRIKAQIRTDNEAATVHSVFDVVVGDRPGLLHTLASFFHRHDISVDLAFVATEGRVIHDSFYVVDRDGQKLSPERLGALAEALTLQLEA
jgi:[protein-PII] uridylyltransferase